MDISVHTFFDKKPKELALYEVLLERFSALNCPFTVKVQKTQISFFNRYMFACVSFARVLKKPELPDAYLTVTFGLGRREDSGRIAACTEAAPHRWTHHAVIGSEQEIDAELLGWLLEAYRFSRNK